MATLTENPEPSRLSDQWKQSSIATIVAHPARVYLNYVSGNNPPLTPHTFRRLCVTSLPINSFRGSTIFFAQLAIRNQFPTHPNLASITIGALFASLLETPLIRMNTPNRSHHKIPFTRCRPTLTSLYFARETAFIAAINPDKATSFSEEAVRFTFGVSVTSACHKFAVLEATKDMRDASHTTPKLSDGFSLFRNIAEGKYSHPAFAVMNTHPINRRELAANLAGVVLDKKVVLARTAYLGLFKAGFALADKNNRTRAITTIRDAFASIKPGYSPTNR